MTALVARSWQDCERAQPVVWPDVAALRSVERVLSRRQGLVSARDCRRLLKALAGPARVLQAGPCAESWRDSPAAVDRLVALLRSLAAAVDGPVVTIGRVGGQYAKPRSAMTERVGDELIPVFRGHAVHDDAPDAIARRPDPWRLLETYRRSAETLLRIGPGVFTSHEALLLEYEEALTRRCDDGWYATSAQMLWIGDRTRQVDGAHVAFLSTVANPIAVKLGPSATADDVAELCRRLNPHRVPGRLTFVTRVGAERVETALPSLIAAADGESVRWLCDPMHGNTRTCPDGAKYRRVPDVVAEVRATADILGQAFGGLHLEVTAEDVQECVDGEVSPTRRYTSLCDPRLNPGQAHRVVAAMGRNSDARARTPGRRPKCPLSSGSTARTR